METFDTNISTSETTSTVVNEHEAALKKQDSVENPSQHGYALYGRQRTDFVRAGRYGRVTRAIINHEPGF